MEHMPHIHKDKTKEKYIYIKKIKIKITQHATGWSWKHEEFVQ